MAAEEETGFQTAAEVSYPTLKRDSAEIVYTRAARKSEDIHLICLVDCTPKGNVSGDMSAVIGELQGLFYDSEALGHTITYQHTAKTVNRLTNGSDLPGDNGLFATGGQANEAAELEAALEALETTPDGKKAVVLWALSTGIEKKDPEKVAEIKEKLGELQAALRAKGGVLITWQKANKPEAWLKDYTGHTYAAVETFRSEVRESLEAAFTDSIKDFLLTFDLTGLASEITGVDAQVKWEVSSNGTAKTINLDFGKIVIAGDGRSATVTAGKLYDHQTLRITVRTALNTELNEAGPVLTASVAGAHCVGFSDEIKDGKTLSFPSAEIDRVLRKMTFQSGTAEAGAIEKTALPGELVLAPDASQWSRPGSSFGGWVDANSRHYKANQLIAMPEDGAVLTATWGHTELELRLGEAELSEAKGNRMAVINSSLFGQFENADGKMINSNNIVSVTFKNQSFKYEYDSDTGAVKGIVGYPIAQYIGADPAKDMVVAYLEPTAEEDGKYDMTIAGQGGVTASWTLQNLLGGMANLRSVRLNGCLDTSAVTNMVGMF